MVWNASIFYWIAENFAFSLQLFVIFFIPLVILAAFVRYCFRRINRINYYKVYVSDEHNKRLILGAKYKRVARSDILSQIIELYYSRYSSNKLDDFEDVTDYDFRKI